MKADLQALSDEENLEMTIANNNMIVNGSYPKQYAEDGLVGFWDGYSNAGKDIHSSNTSVWKNLGSGGSAYDAKYGSATDWGPDYALIVRSKQLPFKIGNSFMANELKDEWTVEVVFEPMQNWFTCYSGIFGNHNEYSLGIVFGQYCTNSQGEDTVEFGLHAPGSRFYAISGNELHNAFQLEHAYSVVMTSSRQNNVRKLLYCNTVKSQQTTFDKQTKLTNTENTFIGAAFNYNDRTFDGKIFCVRCYNRQLSDKELTSNYMLDKFRFKVQ